MADENRPGRLEPFLILAQPSLQLPGRLLGLYGRIVVAVNERRVNKVGEFSSAEGLDDDS